MSLRDKTTHHPPRPRRDEGLPHIVIVEGSAAGKVVPLDRAELVVGKDPSLDLVLTDSGISRRHVKFVRAASGIFNIIDLDSTNGVQVNGVRVDVSVLRDQDRIDLAPCVRLVFTHEPTRVNVSSSPQTPRATEIETPLSSRQIEVARLVAEGLTNTEIGKRLHISPRTVSSHLDHIYARLEIGSRAELTRYLTKAGLD